MALGALSLSTNAGRKGRPFEAKLYGLTTGKLEIVNDGTPGFSVVNGIVRHSGLPLDDNVLVIREYDPGVGAGFRDSRIPITGYEGLSRPNIDAAVPAATTGALFDLTRALGPASTFTLRSGSDANLAIANGNQISATAGLIAGVSQIALVAETLGSGNDARTINYRVTLTGGVNVISGGGVTTPTWVTTPVNNIVAELGDSKTVPSDVLSGASLKRKAATGRNWAASKSGQKIRRSTGSYGTGGQTVAQLIDGTGSVPASMDTRMKADPAAIWRFPAGINSVTSVGMTLEQLKADFRRGAQIAYDNQKIWVVGFTGGDLTGGAAITPADQQMCYDANLWLKNGLTAEFRNVIYDPVYEATQATPGGPGNTKPGFTTDGKHLTHLSAEAQGIVSEATYQAILGYNSGTAPIFDLKGAGNILPNTTLAGTPGAIPDNCTAVVPSGVTVSYATAVVSGDNELAITFTGTIAGASGAFYALDQAISAASIPAGMLPQFGLQFTIMQGSVGVVAVAPELQVTDGTTNNDLIDLDSNGSSASVPNTLDTALASRSISGFALTAPPIAALSAGSAYTTRRARTLVYLVGNSATINATVKVKLPNVH